MKKGLLAATASLVGAVLGLWLIAERGRLLSRSSRAGLRLLGLRNLVNLKGLHLYLYGRATNQYMRVAIRHVIPRLRPLGRRWLADRYHAKVLTPELARAVITIERDIPLRDLEQVIPYATARSIVLQGPLDIAVYECACRQARPNPCRPTQVCLVVGQPFVDFVLEHNPRSSRRIGQAEALELLRAEHDRGHVHTAWFKDACLGRFYAICNCCQCCCVGMEAMRTYGVPLLASSGYVAGVDEGRCNGCGACARACPFGAVSMNGALNSGAAIAWEACMGCGVCIERCPAGALALVRDERKGLPLDVRELA